MVDLICNDLTFCQFFFNSETKKLMPDMGVSYADNDTQREGKNVLIITFPRT